MSGQKQKRLPSLDIQTGINHSPHVVILGAGASCACCPHGDRNGRKLPVMDDFVRLLGVEDVIAASGLDPSGNFEQIYSEIHRRHISTSLSKLDDAVRSYFSGLVLPDTPTLYDYLVLSLRPKDLIITFNWDPLLPQAYKRWRHLGHVLPKLAFLHGNVDLAVDRKAQAVRFLSDSRTVPSGFEPTRLLYPVENKDYVSDPFVKDQWDLALRHLGAAYYVTVYGYSAPKTDVEARALLLRSWRDNPTQTLAEFDVIDIRDEISVMEAWSDFIIGSHGGATNDFTHNILMRHPRRSCEAFAFATLQCSPWREDPFPLPTSLDELEDWIRPLIAEEAREALAGSPHH